ncbi:MAG: tripartite tricarboxylate transporter substrate-binding protein [Hyphomicrobiales bacterium]|jgi:tripartite-type tricarboxylate transporter receptor subunit TctC|nr:tripartite tricarboxylate transporter substrate-binding protein [Hyphomicrobiales bacterium]
MRFAAPALAVLALTLAAAPGAADESYPNRPVTMIVPFAAGGASDVIARLIGEEMGKALGQRIVNENTPGAGGSTAMTRVARAAPDGYTIAIGNSGTAAAVYHIYPDLRFTPQSFITVGMVAKTSPVIAVKNGFAGGDTVASFIDYAQKNPGKVTVGHAGVGSSNFIICKSFLKAAGVEVSLIGYRGAGPALQDLVAGQIDMVCDNATSVAQTIQGGQVKGLVVSSPVRLPNLPTVPTAQEAGVPAFQAQGWNAIMVPAGTPQPIVARLQRALQTAVGSQLVRTRFAQIDTALPTDAEQTPAFMASFVPAEIEKYKLVLKD